MAHGLGQFGVMLLGLQLGMTAGMASVVMQTHAFFTLLLAALLLGKPLCPTVGGCGRSALRAGGEPGGGLDVGPVCGSSLEWPLSASRRQGG